MIQPTKQRPCRSKRPAWLVGPLIVAASGACGGNTGADSDASNTGATQNATTDGSAGSGTSGTPETTSASGGASSANTSATNTTGATTSADTGASGGSAGATSSTGTVGSAGAGACTDYEPVVPAELVALAGREDADAEILALRTSQQIVAPQALYDRISADLTAIRVLEPGLSDLHARDFFYSSISFSVDDAAAAAMELGEYDAWDCVNAHYEVTASFLGAGALLEFGSKRYAAMILVRDEYSTLPGIGSVGYSISDTPDICLAVNGNEHRYLFDDGSGCGNEGCGVHQYSAFDVSAAGEVTPVGTHCTMAWNEVPCDDTQAEPEWLAPLKATCLYETLISP